MNCRRVNGLLSAYLDGELAGVMMQAIREHLDVCDLCRTEHQTLRDTKRMVASLAYKAPREELEALLADRTYRGGDRSSSLLPSVSYGETGGIRRPWPIAATLLLSITGLWLASTALNVPGDSVLDDADQVRPLYPVLTSAGSMTFSPVTLTPTSVSSGSIFGGGAYASPMIAVPTSRPYSSVSVTVLSDGRGNTLRIIQSSSNEVSSDSATPVSTASPVGGLVGWSQPYRIAEPPPIPYSPAPMIRVNLH